MSNKLVGLLLGIGLGGWVYSKVMRRSGGNTQTALIAAVFCGIIGFIVISLLISFLPKP